MNGLRIRIGWALMVALWLALLLPTSAAAQGFEIWRYDRPAGLFRIFDSAGQPSRTVPFAWARDIQFVVSSDGGTVYFAWGTNGWDNQTWKLDVATGATTYLFSNEWAALTGFLPGSNDTKLLSSGSYGEIWLYDTVTGQLSTWQDNDQLPGQFGFNAFRYELGIANNGKAVVRAGYASAGGEAVFLADVCNADATHHLCNLSVISNPGGGGGGWDPIASQAGIDPSGRYAFFRTSANGVHTFWRRDLQTGQDALVWSGGVVSVVVLDSEVIFNAPRPDASGRGIYACDIQTLACRTLVLGDDRLEYFRAIQQRDSTPPVITPHVSGTLGNSLWYVSNVTVSWDVTDPESDVTKTGCDAQSVTTDTAGVTFTCTATSAGGTSTESVTIKRDATKPTIVGTRNPLANPNGWNNTDVAVSFACDDGMSGVFSCVGATTVTTEGAGQFVTGTATDEAGNEAHADVLGINIDKTAPVVTVPAHLTVNATSLSGAMVTFSASSNDSGSGAGAPVCSPSSGSTFAIGTTPVTCSSTDAAGNTGNASFAVTVVNQPPVCSAVTPSVSLIWPANHQWVPIKILGVTDPEGGAITMAITSIFQDEPTNARGDGNTAIDGKGIGTNTAYVRAERAGDGDDDDHDRGNGRVYHIRFSASDGTSSCSGEVVVSVPHDRRGNAIDDGAMFDSTKESLPAGHGHNDGCKGDDHEHGRPEHRDGDKCDHELGRGDHKRGDRCEHERRDNR